MRDYQALAIVAAILYAVDSLEDDFSLTFDDAIEKADNLLSRAYKLTGEWEDK